MPKRCQRESKLASVVLSYRGYVDRVHSSHASFTVLLYVSAGHTADHEYFALRFALQEMLSTATACPWSLASNCSAKFALSELCVNLKQIHFFQYTCLCNRTFLVSALFSQSFATVFQDTFERSIPVAISQCERSLQIKEET